MVVGTHRVARAACLRVGRLIVSDWCGRCFSGRRVVEVTQPSHGGGDGADNPLAVSPQELLRQARPLPALRESVIDDLTEEEEQVFWSTIISA
jgi:hypothetical protein